MIALADYYYYYTEKVCIYKAVFCPNEGVFVLLGPVHDQGPLVEACFA